jgi:hypothetical protein
LAKLDDRELARRVRTRNNAANAARRERLLESGKTQTNVWLASAIRRELDAEASATGKPLSDVVEALLLKGLAHQKQTQRPVTPGATRPAPVDRDQAIAALHAEGLNLTEISQRLFEQGIMTRARTPISRATIRKVLQQAGLKESANAATSTRGQ